MELREPTPLPPHYKDLYDSLLEAVTNKSKAMDDPPIYETIDKEGKTEGRWDCYFFYHWVGSFPGINADDRKKFWAEISSKKVPINKNTWRKVASEGVTLKGHARVLFECSAKYNHYPDLRSFLRGYIAYAHSKTYLGKPVQLHGTKGYKKEVKELLGLDEPSANASRMELRNCEAGIFSNRPFSEGLKESLKRFNAELNYLTIEQVRALDSARRHRHLWIQGPAGTGKTVFAVEAAYRALRAGLSVLIVYRTRQFEQVFAKLLKNVARHLSLLLHLDFMYLLRQQELHGIDSEEFRQTAGEFLPGVNTGDRHLFDLLIVDDCGTYETQWPFLVKYAERLAYRKIFLAAPEQILDNIVYEFKSDHTIRNDEITDVVGQALVAPEHYVSVPLSRNVRNAGDIIDYTNALFEFDYPAGVKEAGKAATIHTDWDALDETLLTLCTELLAGFPPERIKMLVDPGISCPDLDVLTPEEYEERCEDLLGQMPALTRAVLRVSRNGHFLHSTFECDESQIAELNSLIADKKTCFIYTDGEDLGALTDISLGNIPRAGDFILQFDQWISPDIDAKAILSPDAISDPLQIKNAILIYPVPLFIGLESDVVIYIRNQFDRNEKQTLMNPALHEKLKKVRSAHHFLAMSRAKFHLVDVMIY